MSKFSFLGVFGLGVLVGWLIAFWMPVRQPMSEMDRSVATKSPLPTSNHTSSLNVSAASPVQPTIVSAEPERRGEHSDDESLLSDKMKEFWDAANQRQFERAQELIGEIGKLRPQSKEYFETSSHLASLQADWDKVKEVSRECAVLFPKSKSCLSVLVNAELNEGSRAEQQAAIDQCLAAVPGYPNCLNGQAMVRMGEGNFAEAIQIYERLIRENGSQGFRFNIEMLRGQLGYALEGAGRKMDALKEFEESCRAGNSDSCAKAESLRTEL